MKMAQFADFTNTATDEIMGVLEIQRENLQSMFSYPDSEEILDPVTVSGSVISINNAASLYAKNLNVTIDYKEEGWNNIILTHTGKNMLPIGDISNEPIRGVTFTRNNDGSISFSGTTTSSDIQIEIGTITLPIGNYILSGAVNNTYRLRLTIDGTLKGHDVGNGLSFILETPSTISVQTRISAAIGTDVEGIFYPMVKLTNIVDNSYVSYKGNIINIQFPQNIIGGNLDVINGILITTEPIETIQIEPHRILMNSGDNILFANCGNVELEYYRKAMY